MHILEIEGESTSIKEIDKETLLRYMGGAGIGTKILYDNRVWEKDPLSEGNVLVISPGLLTGSGYPTASKTIFMARSPLTKGIGRAAAGAPLGPSLKSLGIGALVLKGRYSKLTGIIIDEETRIVDAIHYKFKDTKETAEGIREEFGDYSTAVIGPAGENLSLISSIECDGRQAARTGIGAVMGSKNIKFIAVKGRWRVEEIKNEIFRDEIKKAMEYIRKDPRTNNDMKYGTGASFDQVNRYHGVFPTKNFQLSWFRDAFEGLDEGKVPELDPSFWTSRYEWKYHPCPGCTKPCSRYVHVNSGKYGEFDVEGLEYETIYSLGSNLNIKDFESVAYLHYTSDLLGLDAISAGATIGWAMEAYERGIIPQDYLQGMEIKFGDADTALELLRRMAYREGKLGNLLSDGVKNASQIIGGSEFAVHSKGMEPPAYDVRGMYGMALAVATSVRGWDHLDAMAYVPELSGRFWYFENVDRSSPRNKGYMVKEMQDFSTFYDLTGICKFSRASLTPERVVKALSIYLGEEITFKDVMEASERSYNLQKLINIKCGLTRNDDTLPPRIFYERIRDGPSEGMVIEKYQFEKMLDEYYQARGWDSEGRPTRLKLLLLGLENID
ncbi:MAG: aldehyde ferredoxin oxidoreductase family protein [Thermoplasmata archaeon]